MTTISSTTLKLSFGVFVISLLSACSSSESDGLSGFNQESAKLTSDNVQYFVDHLSLTTNSRFADNIFSTVRGVVDEQLSQESSGSVILNCESGGIINVNPNIDNNGIGKVDVTMEACEFGSTESEGLSTEASRNALVSGVASMNIAGFDKNSEEDESSQGYITNATLSFKALDLEYGGRSATLDGEVIRTVPIVEEDLDLSSSDQFNGNTLTTIGYQDIYQVTGQNHQFSRKFKVQDYKIDGGLRLEGISVLPALAIGLVDTYREPVSGKIYDETEGVVTLVVEQFEQVINQDNNSVIGIFPIPEIQGADGSSALFYNYNADTLTVKVDEEGDGNYESEVVLFW